MTYHYTRRDFVRQCGLIALPVTSVWTQLHAQTRLNHVDNLPVRLVKEFKNGYLLDVSLDSTKLCLYTGRASESYTLRGGSWTREGGDPGKVPLQVIEVGSWKTTHSIDLRDRPGSASFFPEGAALFAESESFRLTTGLGIQQVIVDLQTGTVQEKFRNKDLQKESLYYHNALPRHMLLGLLSGRQRFYALVRSKLPDYVEVQRLNVSPREAFGKLSGIPVSADRRKLLYAVDHSIVSRRTEDFSVVWERPFEPHLQVRKLAISVDGSRVAIAAVDTSLIESQREYYIAILDGNDGTLLSKLPLNGDAGIEISPDGKLIVVGQRKKDARPQRYRATAQIYEVSSGQIVASVTHDPISTRDGYLWGLLQSRFTPNGKYLITTGDDGTRVWEVG